MKHVPGSAAWDLSTTVGSYRFHHALVQDVLYAGLAPSRRMHLHQTVGEVLVALHSHDLEPVLDELARHSSIPFRLVIRIGRSNT